MSPRPAGGAAGTRSGMAVAAGAGALCCAVGLLAASAWLVGRAAARPPALELVVAIVAVQAFGFGRCLLRYAERVIAHDAALRLLAAARVRLYERLADLAPAGLHGWRYGRLLRLLVTAVDRVADGRLRAMLPMTAAVVAGTAAVALEWWLLPPAGAALLVALCAGGVAAPWAEHQLVVRAGRRTAEARTESAQITVETLAGLPELIACGAAPRRLHGLRRVDAVVAGAAVRAAWTAGLGSGITTLAAGAAVLGALLPGVPAVREGRLDRVLLAVVVLIPLAAFETMGVLSAAVRRLLRSRPDTALIRAVLDAPGPVTDPGAPVPLPPPLPASPPGPGSPSPSRRGGYGLRVRGLRARWPGSDGEDLCGLDLELPPGRRVAMTGPGGAGQSTLAAVLMRFVDYEGSVTLNGVELRDLAGDDVRAIVGLCARDAHVFDTTIAENVWLARPGASGAEVAGALERAGLAGRAGAHGAAVSGDERLRIALARALLADFPVLIVDEPDPGAATPVAGAPGNAGAQGNAAAPGSGAAVLGDVLTAAAGRTVLLITRGRPTPGADPVLRGVDEVITLG